MKNIAIGLGIIFILGAIFFVLRGADGVRTINPLASIGEKPQPTQIIAQNLDTPWGMAFLPSGELLVTERPGRVRVGQEVVAELSQVKEIGEGGLLGIAIDPDFQNNNFIYLYYTYSESNSNTLNRVSRWVYKDKKLQGESIIVDKIPGASNHNGGRLKFGPDNALYVTTGDAQNPSLSQDKNSLAGKILRMKEGKIEVVSFGHRNPQGLAWDGGGRLWETEHGPTTKDELNRIEEGGNFGWPEITGDEKRQGMISPVVQSGSSTWAPSGAAYYKGSLFFGGLRGTALFEYNLVDSSLKEHFKGEFGRIRDVVIGPDNMLYISTSNQDGRGNPKEGDDKIIKIDPRQFQASNHPLQIEAMRQKQYPGSEIIIERELQPGGSYRQYLASYKSDNFKIFSLLTVPSGSKPASGWPVIVFNHGYIPPAEYTTTGRYVAYTDAFSRNGYIVFKPDYRGHGDSEGNPEGAYYSTAYTTDVLNAVSSIKKYKDVDPNNIGMWGHSMGGSITLRSMVTTKDIKAGVIWAGVVASYEDMMKNWRRSTPFTPSQREREFLRPNRQALIDKYGSTDQNPGFWQSISPVFFAKDISGPIQLHHGTSDNEVPLLFSERLNEAMKNAGKEVEFFTYQGDDHNLSNNLSLALQRSVAFFDRFLK